MPFKFVSYEPYTILSISNESFKNKKGELIKFHKALVKEPDNERSENMEMMLTSNCFEINGMSDNEVKEKFLLKPVQLLIEVGKKFVQDNSTGKWLKREYYKILDIKLKKD